MRVPPRPEPSGSTATWTASPRSRSAATAPPGIGRELGRTAIDEYIEHKSTIIRTGAQAPSVGRRRRREVRYETHVLGLPPSQANAAPCRSARPTKAAANTALQVAAEQSVTGWSTDYPDYFPLYTDQGRWKHGKEAWTNWCEGFLGGQMWLFYEAGLGDDWRARAEHYSKLVEERQYDDQVHDLGFVLCPTWKKWWELTGDDARRQVVIQGGKTMATRFNSQGQVPALVPGAGFDLHRHHDERRHHCRGRRWRPVISELLGRRRAALRDDPQVPGTRRRIVQPRRHL